MPGISTNKKVTVITATYNYADYIGEAIESVLNQNFHDFEYIIIDDGSKDDTPQRVKKYSKKLNYIYQENQGQYNAFNKAVSMAQGEYIAFLDADDKWHQDFLKKSVSFLENNPVEMTFCDFSSFDGNNIWRTSSFNNVSCLQDSLRSQDHIFENCLEKLIQQNFIFPSCTVVRRSVFEHLKFDPTLKAADYDFFIKVALHYKVGMITETLTDKRDHPKNTSSNIKDSMISRIVAMENLLTNPQLDSRLVSLAKKRMADAYYHWAYDESKNKNFIDSNKYAALSLRAYFSLKALKAWMYSLVLKTGKIRCLKSP